jgi:ATP-dependent DNA ligase
VEGLARLKVSSLTFDGEAVVCDQDAASDFDKLHSNGCDDQVVLYAFDLLEVNGTTGDLGRCRSARPSLRSWVE